MPNAGSTLYQQINEAAPNDSNYVLSGSNPSGQWCEVGLSDVDTPQVGDQICRVRYRKQGGRTINLIAEVREGAAGAIRGSATFGNISTVWGQGAFFVTGITDYTNLFMRFTGETVGGGPAATAQVGWAEFEVPDAAPTGPSGGSQATVTAAAGGAGTTGRQGGATSFATAAASGAGLPNYSGGSSAAVSAAPAGEGRREASGSTLAAVSVSVTGSGGPGVPEPEGGSTADVTASTSGSGVRAHEAGSASTVLIEATGAGTASDNPAGGSQIAVSTVPTGVGVTERQGGSTVAVPTAVTGAGQGQGSDGAAAGALAAATGAGVRGSWAGSAPAIMVSTFGAGAVPEAVTRGSMATAIRSAASATLGDRTASTFRLGARDAPRDEPIF